MRRGSWSVADFLICFPQSSSLLGQLSQSSSSLDGLLCTPILLTRPFGVGIFVHRLDLVDEDRTRSRRVSVRSPSFGGRGSRSFGSSCCSGLGDGGCERSSLGLLLSLAGVVLGSLWEPNERRTGDAKVSSVFPPALAGSLSGVTLAPLVSSC